jgi:hypothetical protein
MSEPPDHGADRGARAAELTSGGSASGGPPTGGARDGAVGSLVAGAFSAPGKDPDAAATAGSAARALPRLVVALGRSAREARCRGVSAGRWLAGVAVEVAGSVPVRDASALRARYPGRPPESIRDELIGSASRATAAVGAAVGTLSAADFVAPPMLLSAPALVLAETLLVLAIETRLIGELHELYDRVPDGSAGVRARAYLAAWVHRRGVSSLSPHRPASVTRLVSGAQLRSRLLRRFGRNTAALAPMLAGAAAGAALNRRETRRLGRRVAADLAPAGTAGSQPEPR